MTAVTIIATIIYIALNAYALVMWGRFILDLARSFARQWRPRGFALVLAEVAYTLTDPPIRAVRKVLPPLRIGGVALDFAWSIVMLGVIVLIWITVGFLN